MQQMNKKAWAITYGFTMPGCHPFVGQHYFKRANQVRLAPNGTLNVAIFPTFAEAAKAHKIVKRKNPKSEIVRVDVTVGWES
jgi:hypothetical protein